MNTIKLSTSNFSSRLENLDDVDVRDPATDKRVLVYNNTEGFYKDDTKVSTDVALTANSDYLLPTQKAVKTYIGAIAGTTHEPTGFSAANRAASTLSFDNITRTFTIGGVFTYNINYVPYNSTGATKIISNLEGIHYIYFDGATLSETTVFGPEIFRDYCYVASIYWDATTPAHIYLGDERHEFMPWQEHWLHHNTVGTMYMTGLTLETFVIGDGSLDAHAEFGVSAGSIIDEDLTTTITAKVAGTYIYHVYHKLGAAGNWRAGAAVLAPILIGGTGLMQWNEYTGGAWQLTEVVSGRYALVHIFATNDYSATRSIIAVMGQATYINLPQAREGAATEANTLSTTQLPMEEMLLIGTIIYQTAIAYTNLWKSRVVQNDLGTNYVDWRVKTISPSSSPESHSNLSNLDNDDHVQYAILDTDRTSATNTSLTVVNLESTGYVNVPLTSAYKINSINVLSTKNTSNVCVGPNSDGAIITAVENVMIGSGSGQNTTSGSYNLYLGFESGKTPTTAQYNTCVGYKTGTAMTNASNNALLGNQAGAALTTGGYNVMVGSAPGVQTTTATDIIAIGRDAGRVNNVTGQIYIGKDCGKLEVAGTNNTAVGYGALANATSSNNTIYGYNAGNAITTGVANCLVGVDAGKLTTTGGYNTIVGNGSLNTNISGTNNTAVGYNNMTLCTESNNTLVGVGVMNAGTTANQNVGVGNLSLAALTTGDQNTAVGYGAGDTITTGSNSVCIGKNSDVSAVAAAQQVAIGYNATAQGDYYAQIGETGVASQSAKCRFRSQDMCLETWRDTNTRYAYIDGTGNMCKGTQDVSTTSDVQFNTVNITGKLTVGGLIDPTGLQLDPVAANPGNAHTLWIDSGDSNKMKKAAATVVLGPTTSVDNTIPKFDSTDGNVLQTTGVTVDDSNNITGVALITPTSISLTNTINEFSTDGTLGGNSDSAVPTEKAVKTYVDGEVLGISSGTHVTSWSGNWADAQPGSITYYAVDKIVSIRIPTVLAAGNGSTSTYIENTVALPAAIRPNDQYNFVIGGTDNNVKVFAYGYINHATGLIRIWKDVGGSNWTATSSQHGIDQFQLTYFTS